MAKVVHFELPVEDPARAATFYRQALGWAIDGDGDGDEGYWLATGGDADEPGANGALISRSDLHRSPVLVVGVDDLAACLQRVEAAGGQIVLGRRTLPGLGWSAYVRDPEGNVVGLFQSQHPAGSG